MILRSGTQKISSMATAGRQWVFMEELFMEIVRAKTAFTMVGLKRSAGYKRVAAGLLPPPVKIGKRAAGWPKHELDAVVSLIVAGASDETIKQCVKELMARRKSVLENYLAGGFGE